MYKLCLKVTTLLTLQCAVSVVTFSCWIQFNKFNSSACVLQCH